MSSGTDDFVEIVPGLYLVEALDNGRFPYCHCVIARGTRTLLIDASYGVDAVLEANPGWQPDMVAVSHSHPDHVGSLWTFEDAEIWSPIQRSEIFWRFEPMGLRYAGEELAPVWIDLMRRGGIREVVADRHFDDGHVFDTGDIKLECLHTPGHADDHYVFFEPNHGIVLSGDIDLTRFGPWYTQEEGDIDLFLDSIKRVMELDPRIVVSSHKGIITDDIQGRLQRFADVVRQRDERIVSLLSTPATVEELADKTQFFGGYPDTSGLFQLWEANMNAKHLERLQKRGVVVCEGGLWRRV
jgi:glyoxylase-like metal-dependent hydrolase (beta-lactamase superfamily II)